MRAADRAAQPALGRPNAGTAPIADAVARILRDFFGLCGLIACSPIPVVAAVTGHSPAGGAVLSIFCDYRVMARSADPAKPFRIGLNEVQVGLSVPACIQIWSAAPDRHLFMRAADGCRRRCSTRGDSAEIGFVDELAEVDQVVPRALTWMQDLLKLPSLAIRPRGAWRGAISPRHSPIRANGCSTNSLQHGSARKLRPCFTHWLRA